jgi:hypothetical protein
MKITGNEFVSPVNEVGKVRNTPIGPVNEVKQHTGLTIRQELAARFMEAIIASGRKNLSCEMAKAAFQYADAFILENNSLEIESQEGKNETV